MTDQLALTNIVNISVSATPVGASAYNTSNLAIFTFDTPGGGFGSDGYKIYLQPGDVATDFGTSSDTYKMANAVFSQQPNILAGRGYLVVIPFIASETLDEAITRTADLVQYFGLMSSQIETEADTLAAAAVVQAVNKIAFFVQRDSAEVDPGGILDLIRTGSFTKSRGLFYGADNDTDALVMMASYAGRALSVDFSGSNTTLTMQLKTLTGVQPDPSITQTILTAALAAGADSYPSLQGVASLVTSGLNSFFDQVYNLQWFAGALQIAGFNFLKQTSTKIPQTEAGMDALKSAYRTVCEQAVTNQYCAPGSWTSPTTFGDLNKLLNNVSEFGFYIYSTPISQQLQVDREARIAPLVQIALKEAGAIHSSNVIVNVNP